MVVRTLRPIPDITEDAAIQQLQVNTPVERFGRFLVMDIPKCIPLRTEWPCLIRVLRGHLFVEHHDAGDTGVSAGAFGEFEAGLKLLHNMAAPEVTRAIVIIYRKRGYLTRAFRSQAYRLEETEERLDAYSVRRDLWRETRLSSDVTYEVIDLVEGIIPSQLYRSTYSIYLTTEGRAHVGMGDSVIAENIPPYTCFHAPWCMPYSIAGENLRLDVFRVPYNGEEDRERIPNWHFNFPAF